MRVTNIRSTTVKTYRVAIEDGEVLAQRHGGTGKQYRVDLIIVTKRDGNVDSVKLAGPVLKKDGTDSLNRNSEGLYGQSAWPEWLHGIVGGLA